MSNKGKPTPKVSQAGPQKSSRTPSLGAGTNKKDSSKKLEKSSTGTSPESCSCGVCLECSPTISLSSISPAGASEETFRENIAKELKGLGNMYPTSGSDLQNMGFSKEPPPSFPITIHMAQDPKTPSTPNQTEAVEWEKTDPSKSSSSNTNKETPPKSELPPQRKIKITELLEKNVYGDQYTPDQLIQDLIDAGHLKNSVLFYKAHQTQIPFPIWVKFLNRTSQKPYDSQDLYLLGQIEGFLDGLHQADHQTIANYKTTFDTVLGDIQVLLSRNQNNLVTSDDQRKKMVLALDQSNKNATLILQAVHKVEGIVTSIPCSIPSSSGKSNKTPDPVVNSFQLLNTGQTIQVVFDGKKVSCKVNMSAPNASDLKALGQLLNTTPLHLAPQLQLLGMDKIINTFDTSYSSVEEILKAASED